MFPVVGYWKIADICWYEGAGDIFESVVCAGGFVAGDVLEPGEFLRYGGQLELGG